jgi:hypothetical protein
VAGPVEREIAGIVDEWFQREPTTECQQNLRRGDLIRDLVAQVERVRRNVAEEIAQAIEAAGRDPYRNLAWMYPEQAAEIVREHGKES